ncbi:MAG: ABC transporter ATP-binding protein [Bacillota bacterium]
MTILECRSVTRTYRTPSGDICALPSTSLAVQEGGSLALVGPSGSGKSTLLSLVAGLERPTTGDVWFKGAPYSGLSMAGLLKHRRKHIGLLTQNPIFIRGLSLWDNIAIPLRLNGWAEQSIRVRLSDLLARLGIADLRWRQPSKVSGGELQRAALARAIAHRPALVLADEPTGSLDQANRNAAAELMIEVARETGCALVVATHDVAVADRMQQVVRLAQESSP